MATDPADKLMNLAIDGDDPGDDLEVVRETDDRDEEVVEETVTTTRVRRPAKTEIIVED